MAVHRALAILAASIVLSGLLTGCAAGPTSSAPLTPARMVPQGPGPVTVAARAEPKVGTVLVDGRGYTLYVFEPDGRQVVSCTDACAGSWPPLTLRHGSAAHAADGVRQRMLGSMSDPAGGRVVTYHGWPLYTYASDVRPGQANGQALDLNGGPWYVIRPSGEVVVPPQVSGMQGMTSG